MFDELTKDTLSEDEKQKFNRLKKAEQLIEQAKTTIDNTLKIKLLKQSIELDAQSSEAYYLLANTFHIIKEYETALENIEKALVINSSF